MSLMFYFITQLFIRSAMQAIVVKEFNFNEKANGEPSVQENGEYTVSPDYSPELAQTIKESWRDFVLWSVNWLPERIRRKFEPEEEDL